MEISTSHGLDAKELGVVICSGEEETDWKSAAPCAAGWSAGRSLLAAMAVGDSVVVGCIAS